MIRVRLEPTVNRRLECEVKARNSFFVPNQTKRQRRSSTSGTYASAYLLRRRLLLPSDAITISAPNSRAAGLIVDDFGLEHQLDAKIVASPLQDVQQSLATDAAETVAARRDRATLEMYVDVFPTIERRDDLACRLRIGLFEVASV